MVGSHLWLVTVMSLDVGGLVCYVTLVESVGHKLTSSTPQSQHPKSPLPLVERGFVCQVHVPDSPAFKAMQLAVVKACFATATGHSLPEPDHVTLQ